MVSIFYDNFLSLNQDARSLIQISEILPIELIGTYYMKTFSMYVLNHIM